jgi:hypothetical protein
VRVRRARGRRLITRMRGMTMGGKRVMLRRRGFVARKEKSLL